jgi:hypothetical protein
VPEGWELAGLAAALVAAWFAGAVVMGTLGAIDSGRRDGTVAGDFWRNSLRGLVYVAPAACVLVALRFIQGAPHEAWTAGLLLIAGACQGLCYEVAHRVRPMPQYAATEWAECFTGSAMGLGAVLAVVLA